MIKLDNIRKLYRTQDVETAALDDVSLEIRQGEFVAAMGPSGCGKSTLLGIVGMIDTPTSGAYTFNGDDVSRYPERRLVDLRRRHLGFIFQNFNLIDDLTVWHNVELPLLYQGLAKARRRARVWEVLDLVGLKHRARHFPAQLSGGQQQRVAIARAVVGGARVILADEPTGNLDSASGADVIEMLERLNRDGTTILMVTHTPEYAARAQRIVRLRDGRIVDTPTTIM